MLDKYKPNLDERWFSAEKKDKKNAVYYSIT